MSCMATDKIKPTSVRLSETIVARIDKFRDKHNLSMAEFLERASKEFLDQYEDLPGFEEMLAKHRKPKK